MSQLMNFCNCIKDSIWNLFPFSLQSTLHVSVLCMFSFFTDQELFRLCLCTKQTGDHSIWRESRVASGHREDVSEREWLCPCWQVWAHLWNAYNLPHLSLHCHPYNCLCTAFCHHSHPEVCFSLTSLSTDDRFSTENEIVFMFTVLCLHVGL